jgi:Lrp/AsnC family transcriptional regulator for asnA, asnC and gidA
MTGPAGAVVIRVPDRLRVVGPPSWTEAPSSARLAIDEIDTQLLAQLVRDSRATNRSLSAWLGVSEVTVATRLRRLVAERILIFTAMLDFHAAGYEWFAIARITVTGVDPARVARDVASLRACNSAAVVTGSADVQATFLLTDRDALDRLKQTELAAVDGIAATSLHLVTRSYMSPQVRSSFMARRATDLWLPAPTLRLDDLDVGLIEALIADARQPYRQIGRQLNVSEGTVRARRARLERAGLLQVVAMRNPLAFGQVGVLGQLGLRVRGDAIAEVALRLREVAGVVQVVVTIGEFDVMAAIAAPDSDRLAALVHTEVRTLDGVRDTDTLEVREIVHFVPFLKQHDHP